MLFVKSQSYPAWIFKSRKNHGSLEGGGSKVKEA
jgi:hypothetical protein